MVKKYIPVQGDIVYLDFNPQSGHEQKGKRPALIISNEVFNEHLGLAFACPITNTDRGYPFHIKLENTKTTGYVMCEQMKSLDYNARKISFVEKAESEVIQTALALLKSIL
ncbi:MAG: type II toxin-antitoxin system PemK/MazF family toxin [Sulfurimonas sp.]|nr:type II toxin-antitoxin system PemK/MazF family toxin [Sulfurimonas sp.]